MPRLHYPTAVTLLLLWPVASQAEDWPQWRGPKRDGVWSETGILESFPADGLKVHWRAKVGPGWSSPVVAQGRIYTDKGDLILAELTAKGYKEVCRTRLLEPVPGRKAWPPPAFANRQVFARNDRELICASLAARR